MGHADRMGAGAGLFLVYLLLRKSKKRADMALARGTGKVWFEMKILAALLLVFFCLPRPEYLRDIWQELVYAYAPTYSYGESSAMAVPGDVSLDWEILDQLPGEERDAILQEYGYPQVATIEQVSGIGTTVTILQENGGWLLREYLSELADHMPGLLALLWGLYLLIFNDWRYNKRPWRRGVIAMLAARELKYPLQKRLSRMNGYLGLAVALLWLEVLALLVLQTTEVYLPSWAVWNLLGLPWLLALGIYVWIAWRQRRLWTDFGAVADQAGAIRAGRLERELALQEDSDLSGLADDLNHIGQGLHQAVEERTRRDRKSVV